MKIILNKYNYIISYCIVGDLENSIEVPYVENPLDYQFINGELIYNPIPSKPSGINLEWTGTEWIEEASLLEQEEFLRLEIIEKTSKLLKMQSAGFGDSKLELEIEELKARHLEVTHQIAMGM